MTDSRKKRLWRQIGLMTVTVLTCAAPAVETHASPYDEIVFMGDSLSDNGAVTARHFSGSQIFGSDGKSLPDFFLQNPGPNQVQLLSDMAMRYVEGYKSDFVNMIARVGGALAGDETRRAKNKVHETIAHYAEPSADNGWGGWFKSLAGKAAKAAVSFSPEIEIAPTVASAVEKGLVARLPAEFDAFAATKIRSDIEKKILSELFPQYSANVGPRLSRTASTMSVAQAAYIFWGIPLLPAFTTNPDATWAFHLARSLGSVDAWKPAADGGNNYAWGGARVSQAVPYILPSLDIGIESPRFHYLIPSVKDQVTQLLRDRPDGLSRHGLYSVWVGANDLITTLKMHERELAAPGTQAEEARRAVMVSRLTARDVAEQIRRLGSVGAGTVMAFNLPDIGRTPRALGMPAQARTLLSYMASTFNQSLNDQLADYRGNLVVVDIHDMLNEVIDHPDRYGLRNVARAACGAVDANLCGRSALVEPDAYRNYLFADGIHPSGIGHAFIADYVLSVLQAPTRIGLLAEAPLAGSRASLYAIQDRLRYRDDFAGLQSYASYQHANDSQRGGDDAWKPALGNRMDLLVVGLDGRVAPHWLIGVSASQVQHNATLGQRAGWFRLGQTQLSAYGRYRLGDWSTALIGSVGYLNYRDVAREFSIGPARLREQGTTTGTASALSILTNYDWNAGSFTLTPSVGLTLQNVNVRGYNESRDGGRSATSMNYREQTRRSLASTLGLRLQVDLRHGDYLWQPYTALAWEHEFNQGTREVRGHLREMAGSFAQPVAPAPSDNMLVSAGLNVTHAAAWSGLIGYQGRYGRNSQSQAVQASVRYRF